MPPTTPPTIAPVWLDDLEVAPEVVVVWTPTAVVVYIVVIGTPLLDMTEVWVKVDEDVDSDVIGAVVAVV